MDKEILVSIVTPTYNRGEKLKELFASLKTQIDHRFEWIVIDDGSTDQTTEIVEGFIKDGSLTIKYSKKENHGKHTALNFSHKLINGKYVVIVDSDDCLTDDAVLLINKMWQQYDKDEDIAGITFQKETFEGRVADKNTKGTYISTFSKEYYKGFRGDHCETFRKEIFTSRKFPVFDDERFIAEGQMWYLLTRGKKIVFTDKSIYRFDYLPDGLSQNIRKIMARNPQGAYWNAIQMINKDFGFKMQLKNTILALYYGRLSGKNTQNIYKDINNWFLFCCALMPYVLVCFSWNKYI